ncbi:MAG: hypothetical protein CFE44_18910 [Burkholderiales bacterium PBB4]|nr:MAG: hypothetical protein CFE44_18910 [Burkholderiales bacterium PBB4]
MNEPIEMEVLAIDDAAPPHPKPETQPEPDPAWRQWQGRVKRLDARWWPLWVVLGVIVVFLVLTVGVVFGAILLIVKIVSGIIGGIVRFLTGTSSSTSLR